MEFAELVSKCVDVVGNRFLLCNILSQRVKQLSDGAPPKVTIQGKSNTEIALHEIHQGLIKYEFIEVE